MPEHDLTDRAASICVAALYRFTSFADCEGIRRPIARLCRSLGVKGTLLIAPEGINGTVAGADEAIEALLAHLRGLPGCATLDVRYSRADAMPFFRMKVRVRREIVTMGEPGIDPASNAGHYVAPDAWNDLIADPGTILIDTRNDYEVAIGTFPGAINPATSNFRDFPAWFRNHRSSLLGEGPPPRVAMFCTGGIRCEKATAFLKAEGVEEVYHLKGGILAYLEAVSAQDSLWDGECFVFDQRVTVGQGLARGDHVLCHGCRRPVGKTDRASPSFREGISCPACHAERDEKQRAGYAERMRQIRIAEARGLVHIGREAQSDPGTAAGRARSTEEPGRGDQDE